MKEVMIFMENDSIKDKEKKEEIVKEELKSYDDNVFSMMLKYIALTDGLFLFDLLHLDDHFFDLENKKRYELLKQKTNDFLQIESSTDDKEDEKEEEKNIKEKAFYFNYDNSNGKIVIKISPVSADKKEKVVALVKEKTNFICDLHNSLLTIKFEDNSFDAVSFKNQVVNILTSSEEELFVKVKEKDLSEKAAEFVNIAQRFSSLNDERLEDVLALHLNSNGELISVFGENIKNDEVSDFLEKRYDIFLRTFKRPGIVKKH